MTSTATQVSFKDLLLVHDSDTLAFAMRRTECVGAMSVSGTLGSTIRIQHDLTEQFANFNSCKLHELADMMREMKQTGSDQPREHRRRLAALTSLQKHTTEPQSP